MNILASYKWLKEYVKTDLTAEEFARELSLKSMSVESIDKGGDKFNNMVVGVIREVKPHPKADRLRLVIADIGGREVEIVCGGSNLEVGHKVFVALPGSKVRWHGEGELVELKETEIRGVKSFGMICSPIEVGFDKLQGDEREIWDLTAIINAPAGAPIESALDLDDTVFDIEITTNRPDCMGMIGLAREGGAATGSEFKLPAERYQLAAADNAFAVSLEAKKLCPRYLAATVKNVKVGPSPWWLQKRLLQAGHRPINNIVDITNYVLHEYGQPLHAFDASRIGGNKIVVRPAKKGEKLLALDGKEYQLSSKHLVIADAERPLAIAGVMGGKESGTTEQTTTVIFEAATFDPISIRKTARDLNLYSDSQLVFEKGLSTEALPAALARAVQLAKEIAGGELSGLTDQRLAPYKKISFPVYFKKIRSRIGVDLADDEISKILTQLGFTLTKQGGRTVAEVPFWRDHDIEAEVDLTEEVARIYGYHRLPLTLPSAPPPTTADDSTLVWEAWLKRFLATCGYTEFFGYSFIDVKTLEKYGLSPVAAVAVANPLSDDLSHLRPSLMPSLLRDIERNQANAPQGRVFELSRVYTPKENDLPVESFRLVIAEYGRDSVEDAFMELKGTLELIGSRAGVKFVIGAKPNDERWHGARSALVAVDVNGSEQAIGLIGEVAPVTQEAFGLTRPVMAVDLDLEALLPMLKRTLRYTPVADFPSVTRDLSFIVSEQTAYADLASSIRAQSVLVTSLALADIYRGAGVAEGKKSLTISITCASVDRTLTSAEVDEVITQITHALTGSFGAVLRS